jgi:hypothetical protein
MARAIYCDCGLVCRGDTDEELLRAAQRHLREEHPGLAGRVPSRDLLAMAVEVDVPRGEDAPAASGARVTVRRHGGIATVLLDRPHRRNALSLPMIRTLTAHLGEVVAGAEGAARTGDDDGAHPRVGAERGELLGERPDHGK